MKTKNKWLALLLLFVMLSSQWLTGTAVQAETPTITVDYGYVGELEKSDEDETDYVYPVSGVDVIEITETFASWEIYDYGRVFAEEYIPKIQEKEPNWVFLGYSIDNDTDKLYEPGPAFDIMMEKAMKKVSVKFVAHWDKSGEAPPKPTGPYIKVDYGYVGDLGPSSDGKYNYPANGVDILPIDDDFSKNGHVSYCHVFTNEFPNMIIQQNPSWTFLGYTVDNGDTIYNTTDAYTKLMNKATKKISGTFVAQWKKEAMPVAKKITEVTPVDSVEVEYGTSETDALAKLPAQVTVKDADGNEAPANVTWAFASGVSYDGDTAGDYKLVGTITLPEGWENPDNKTAAATITVLPQPLKKITEVVPIDPVEVEYGTSEADALAKLPTQVTIKDAEDNEAQADVAWAFAAGVSYDGETAGDYNLVGTITLPEGWENPDNKTAAATITVLPQPLKKVKEVTPVDSVEVEYGTSEADALAKLPNQVTIKDADNNEAKANVTWAFASGVSYDGETAGDYNLVGTITLPEGWENPDEVTAAATIAVQAQPTPEDITITDDATKVSVTVPKESGLSREELKLVVTKHAGKKVLMPGKYEFSQIYDIALIRQTTNEQGVVSEKTVTVDDQHPLLVRVPLPADLIKDNRLPAGYDWYYLGQSLDELKPQKHAYEISNGMLEYKTTHLSSWGVGKRLPGSGSSEDTHTKPTENEPNQDKPAGNVFGGISKLIAPQGPAAVITPINLNRSNAPAHQYDQPVVPGTSGAALIPRTGEDSTVTMQRVMGLAAAAVVVAVIRKKIR